MAIPVIAAVGVAATAAIVQRIVDSKKDKESYTEKWDQAERRK